MSFWTYKFLFFVGGTPYAGVCLFFYLKEDFLSFGGHCIEDFYIFVPVKLLKLKQMKKVLLAVAMVAFALTSNAQLWFGGALGFEAGSNLNSVALATETSTISTQFAPKVGFGINDKFSVGAIVSLGFEKTKDKDDKDNFDKMFNWSVAPFARYAFAEIGDFSVLAEGTLGLGKSKITNGAGGVETSFKSDMFVDFVVTPVLSYEVSDHFNLEFGMDFLSVGFYHYAEEMNEFRLGARSTGASLGFIYKL